MFGRLILLIAFFIAVLTIIRMINKTPKSQLKNLYWKIGLSLLAITLVLLAVTGRVHWISAIIGAILPFAQRAIPFITRFFPVFQHIQRSPVKKISTLYR